MRALLWTALALGAASTAGCFVEANNNPPPACNDGLDNDGDGKIDFPADPGCTSIDDNTETDPAPVTACNDGVDNDGDGRVDYPDDPGCSSVNDDSEGDPQVPVGRLAATWHLQDWND